MNITGLTKFNISGKDKSEKIDFTASRTYIRHFLSECEGYNKAAIERMTNGEPQTVYIRTMKCTISPVAK